MMRRTVIWLVGLALVTPAWSRAQGVPDPRLPPPKAAADKDAPAADKKDPKKQEDSAEKAQAPPILFHPEPFPPPAPPVMDPRTRAWEQVQGGAYVTNVPPVVSAAPERPPAELPPPPEKEKEDKKDNGKKDADKADKGPQVGVKAYSPYQLVGHKSAAPRERVLRITRNQRTGAWEIVDVTRQP